MYFSFAVCLIGTENLYSLISRSLSFQAMKAIKQGSSAKDVVITAITALEVEVTAHLNPDINEIAISMIQVRRYMASIGYF